MRRLVSGMKLPCVSFSSSFLFWPPCAYLLGFGCESVRTFCKKDRGCSYAKTIRLNRDSPWQTRVQVHPILGA